MIFTSLISAITGCDLLNSSLEPDFLGKIDNEIAWANAPGLNITLDAPDGWITSPSTGTLSTALGRTIRQGFPFDLECSPSSSYGFQQWLVFETSVFTNEYKTDNNGKNVIDVWEDTLKILPVNQGISESGLQTATFVIDTMTPVTIVPWCSPCPRLAPQTNPPLNPILTPFPYNQRINLWFTMNVRRSTVELGKSIEITGINLIDSIHGQRGQFFDGDGDLTDYFTLVFPGETSLIDHVSLVPKVDTASELTLLSISIIVGPDIVTEANVGMAQAEIISYQTDAREAQKAYRAEGIEACQTAEGDFFSNTGTGMTWNNPEIDRRFNGSEKETVYLKFAVPQLEGASLVPDWIRITERYANDLRGVIMGGEIGYEYYYTGSSDVGIEGGTGKFTITHGLQTTYPGIIQLLVQPGNGDITVPEYCLSSGEALSEGQYVTIVLDTVPPDLNDLQASLSSPSSVEDGTGNYLYGTGVPMTLTLGNLANIADNGSEGGLSTAQAWSLPWTMDAREDLLWFVQIGRDDQDKHIRSASWLKVYESGAWNNTWTQSSLSALTEGSSYPVLVKFKDKKGNESGWKETGYSVKYTTSAINSVYDLRAECSADGSLITVTWLQPGTYQYPEIVIRTYRASAAGDIFEYETRSNFNKAPAASYVIPVSPITADKVQEGNAVSGVYGFEISMITHNTAGTSDPVGPIWVYNIPAMVTQGTGTGTNSNTVRITSANMGELPVSSIGANTNGKNYVLTRDITLTAGSGTWTPIGTGTGATNAFRGKFYGNGHTLSFNHTSGSGFPAAVDYAGVFGSLSGAEIRDLCVEYSQSAAAGANAVHIGGIAAYAEGSAAIRNCIVRGKKDVSLNVASTNTSAVYLGGIAGNMQTSVIMQNCLAGLDLKLVKNVNGDIYAGGAVGNISDGTTAEVILGDIRVSSDVSARKGDPSPGNYTGNIYAGGIAGYCAGTETANRGKLQRLKFGGTLTLGRNSSLQMSSGNSLCGGGIAGRIIRPRLEDCVFERSGKISVPDDNSYHTYIGGIAGYLDNNSTPYGIDTFLTRCTAQGDMDVRTRARFVYPGGIVGVLSCNSSNPARFRKCDYEQGTIYVQSGANTTETWVGGIAGDSERGDFEDCFSRAERIEVNISSGSLLFGGFFGVIFTTTVKNCGNTSPLVMNETSRPNSVDLGGFLGQNSPTDGGISRLENCWSSGNVSSVSSAPILMVGGLVGTYSGAIGRTASIFNCYASGDVSAVSLYDQPFLYNSSFSVGGLVGSASETNISSSWASGNVSARLDDTASGTMNIGGLVGISNTNDSFTNCYALGNVLADNSVNTAITLYAGGIVGRFRGSTVKYNFAKGSVKAQSLGTSPIYSGGIVGSRDIGVFFNNAALGANITALGGSSRTAARIYANPASAPGISFISDNYAKESIRVETSAGYGDINPLVHVFESIPPVMTGLPYLQGSITNASIGGIFISDSGGSGLSSASSNNTAMSVSSSGTAGSPVWNGSIITNINLGSLSAVGNYTNFDITLSDNAGNTAVYRIRVSPNKASPAVLADYDLSGPTRQSSIAVSYPVSGPQGQTAADSTFHSQGIWSSTAYLGFNSPGSYTGIAPWDFSSAVGKGYPVLLGTGGQ